MNFILSPHAEEKIIQRQISLKILQDILNNPEQILEEDGLKVYQGTFVAINNKTYLLRIYINDLVEHQKIVTLYVTSKLRKYRQLSNES
ncbi:MAG: DUF4258 domain-containing protein [Microcystis aeruginosa Ma_QC_Ch_20071001_S25]|uniref:DUF4258 domain-containing protein n=2 Tax=Microcystis aeruginosa TaxID=1126 RepID=A0A552FLQ1_MICAE|nr:MULTISPECIES: DUF4258 domain-containing protein [unclassified Microcystis]MCA2764743.1 DUF4258 domain-containing protein [Microcystis sp. M151S2]MDJ0547378.1 DUF4258 domain-containing protein [Microcystis sp. M53601_WE4]TRU26012.1 MAG: DUF4258 domain-containing protein [Microcystis aeruginosa Ma_SC_T_19800800_S464]TRU47474.1 MAG: DUF4258 domain-containing protein [Microcystis aeruginosa Ma_QC_Ch_20071001_S25]TRU47663.1 MAG: DUF4258 domain-containing protein [Microcystis aeruginosa Ma_QC_Ch_